MAVSNLLHPHAQENVSSRLGKYGREQYSNGSPKERAPSGGCHGFLTFQLSELRSLHIRHFFLKLLTAQFFSLPFKEPFLLYLFLE